jgi:hypothetical protein
VNLGITDLSASFQAAAVQNQLAASAGDYSTANRAFAELAEAYASLRNLGEPGVAAFVKLLKHEAAEIRCWAARYALQLDASEAEQVLEALSAGPPSLAQIDAEGVLRQWREGQLAFPE